MGQNDQYKLYANLDEPQRTHARRYEALLRSSDCHCIRFQPILAKICGDVAAGLMLSQAIYWSARTEPDGWFFKNNKQWTEETGLSRYEQVQARKQLRKRQLWHEKRRGIPPTLNFRVDFEAVSATISDYLANPAKPGFQKAEIPYVEGADSSNLNNQQPELRTRVVCRVKPTNKGSSYKETESTTHTTANRTPPDPLLTADPSLQEASAETLTLVTFEALSSKTHKQHNAAIIAAEVAIQLGIAGRESRRILEEQIANEMRKLPGVDATETGRAMIEAWTAYQQSSEGRSKYRKSIKTFFSTPTWKEQPELWERTNADGREHKERTLNKLAEAKRIARGLDHRTIDVDS